MNLFLFWFSSPYDQLSLLVMAIGLILNAIGDAIGRHRARVGKMDVKDNAR